jgi:hypothetical protein
MSFVTTATLVVSAIDLVFRAAIRTLQRGYWNLYVLKKSA